jgi:hypothetical protein
MPESEQLGWYRMIPNHDVPSREVSPYFSDRPFFNLSLNFRWVAVMLVTGNLW